MICITGDTHGNLQALINRKKPDGSEWTTNDKLIICGDFGFVFSIADENGKYADAAKLDYIADYLPQQVLFVSGNHENFDRLYAYPDVPLYGGTAKVIRKDKLYLLKRGECYTIDGRKFLAFGGAYSIDKGMRREGVSWWRQELPSNEEYHHAAETIKKNGCRFDYIITHTCPQRIMMLMGKYVDVHDAELTGFLDWIFTEVDFSQWFFGHWHIDKTFYDGKMVAAYENIYVIDRINGE